MGGERVVIQQVALERLAQKASVFLHVPACYPIHRLACFPTCVSHWEADGAGTVTGSPRVLFGEEEDTVGDIAASSDGAQRGGAVETAIDAVAAVTTQSPWHNAGVRLAIRADKFPDLAHASPFIWRHVDILRAGFIGGNKSLWPRSGYLRTTGSAL
jgi:hypothetical protein